MKSSNEVESESIAVQENTHTAVTAAARAQRGIRWSRLLAYGVLPTLAFLLTATAAWLKWLDASNVSQNTTADTVAAAKHATTALLSYQADTVEKDLNAAQGRLTGEFKTSYAKLTNEVVIPGSKEQRISAAATVPAAAPVSVTPKHAVVLLFVNQTVTVGTDAPTDTSSVVRVSMDKVSDRWLVSGFEPI